MICYCHIGNSEENEIFYEREINRAIQNYAVLRDIVGSAAYHMEPLRTDYDIINDAPKEIRENCIYPQILSSYVRGSTHYTERENCDSFQLLYTFHGRGRLRVAHRTYCLVPGTFFLVDCKKYYYFHSDSPEGWGYQFIHFDGEMPSFSLNRPQRTVIVFPAWPGQRLIGFFRRSRNGP